MPLTLALGGAILIVGSIAIGVTLFGRTGHRDAVAMTNVGDVNIGAARRARSLALLIVLTLGLAGLAAASIGAIVFLGGLALTA